MFHVEKITICSSLSPFRSSLVVQIPMGSWEWVANSRQLTTSSYLNRVWAQRFVGLRRLVEIPLPPQVIGEIWLVKIELLNLYNAGQNILSHCQPMETCSLGDSTLKGSWDWVISKIEVNQLWLKASPLLIPLLLRIRETYFQWSRDLNLRKVGRVVDKKN